MRIKVVVGEGQGRESLTIEMIQAARDSEREKGLGCLRHLCKLSLGKGKEELENKAGWLPSSRTTMAEGERGVQGGEMQERSGTSINSMGPLPTSHIKEEKESQPEGGNGAVRERISLSSEKTDATRALGEREGVEGARISLSSYQPGPENSIVLAKGP